MRLYILVALMLLSGAPAAHGQTAGPVHQCVEDVFDSPWGAERNQPLPLEMLCPALMQNERVSSLPLQDALGADATPGQLLDLQAAIVSTGVPAARQHPDTGALHLILAEMDTTETTPGLWERLSAWLLAHFDDSEEAPTWLVEWLENVEFDGDIAAFLFQAVLVAIVVFALGVVLNELMKADLRIPARKRARRQRKQGQPTPNDSVAPTWSAIAQLPTGKQPAALLGYLLDLFESRGVIARQRAWTNREYEAAVRHRLPHVAAAFTRIAAGAERAVYGGRTPDAREERALRENAEKVRMAVEQGV